MCIPLVTDAPRRVLRDVVAEAQQEPPGHFLCAGREFGDMSIQGGHQLVGKAARTAIGGVLADKAAAGVTYRRG